MTEEDEFDENLPNPVRSILGTYRSVSVSYTHLTLPTICSV